MKRGQTIIEFLFLLMIIIIYISTLVVPLTADARSAISDTEKIARANNETQKLANAVEKVSLLGDGSRQSVDVFVPEDTTIICIGPPHNDLNFQVTFALKPFPTVTGCDGVNGTCTKSFTFSPDVKLECNFGALAQYSKTTVTVEKNADNVTLTGGS